MAKALDGINLVEFDSNLGAAYAAMLLAENGARAIKVEPVGGSRERGTPHFHVLNRSQARDSSWTSTPAHRRPRQGTDSMG